MGNFINLSNHPSINWSKKQIEEAQKIGDIIDIPFFQVPAETSEEEISRIASDIVREIMEYNPSAVMCQGEFTLAYNIIFLLKEKGVNVVAACSERRVQENNDREGKTHKLVTFEFVKFRKYI